MVRGTHAWHDQQQAAFHDWLVANDLDPNNADLSMGYLPLAQVDLQGSFGTTHSQQIWDVLGDHLDIYRIQAGTASQTFDYCWTDSDYQQQQIDRLRPGYRYHGNQLCAGS